MTSPTDSTSQDNTLDNETGSILEATFSQDSYMKYTKLHEMEERRKRRALTLLMMYLYIIIAVLSIIIFSPNIMGKFF